jgi:hypothetical protein
MGVWVHGIAMDEWLGFSHPSQQGWWVCLHIWWVPCGEGVNVAGVKFLGAEEVGVGGWGRGVHVCCDVYNVALGAVSS